MDTLFALPYGPLVIFLIRIVDVSLGTIRMITTVRGQRLLSAGLGFVEVLLWVVAVGYASSISARRTTWSDTRPGLRRAPT